jgi:hypothetical protein
MTHERQKHIDPIEAAVLARAALLDHLEKDEILAFYETANGKEISSGKFANPESSAALAANSFGFFLSAPQLLSLPDHRLSAGSACTVTLEAEMQFPWSGGLHPCVDIAIDTAQILFGIESKRYEPFRDRKKAVFSEAYFRPCWGARMAGFERARDLLTSGKAFSQLDAAQLVKHAFGLRTQAVKRNKTAHLVYLYSEPTTYPDGRELSSEAVDSHRNELAQFAEIIGTDDEVTFSAVSYMELLEHWSASPNELVRHHGSSLIARFDISR